MMESVHRPAPALISRTSRFLVALADGVTPETETPAIALSVDKTSVMESCSNIQISITATASEAASSNTTTSADGERSSDSAIEKTDYANIASFNITIESGQITSSNGYAMNDTIVELTDND